MPVGLTSNKYIVVCQNRRQAYDLFDRLSSCYRRMRRTTRITADPKRFAINNGFEVFWFVSQRKLDDILHEAGKIDCVLVSWQEIDKWMDNLEQAVIEKEKKE